MDILKALMFLPMLLFLLVFLVLRIFTYPLQFVLKDKRKWKVDFTTYLFIL